LFLTSWSRDDTNLPETNKTNKTPLKMGDPWKEKEILLGKVTIFRGELLVFRKGKTL